MTCFGCPQSSANSHKLGKLYGFYTSVPNCQLQCSLWINSCMDIFVLLLFFFTIITIVIPVIVVKFLIS